MVICSPAARASDYVDDEIRRFVDERGPEHIIPIIVAGGLGGLHAVACHPFAYSKAVTRTIAG